MTTLSLLEAAATGALVALDLGAITLAVWRSRGVERTIAWILAILAFPVVGAGSYLLVASPHVSRDTRRKRLATSAVRAMLGRGALGASADYADRCPALPLAAAISGMAPTARNQVELLADDAHAFSRIEGALREAKHRIYAEYYIIRRDETGRRFLAILAERAKAGVEVRLLYDAVGSMGLDAERLDAVRDAGGHAEAFLPVNPLARRWSVHLRNHRKLIAIDGAIGFTGGMNVGDEYSGRARLKGSAHFRDSHVELRGPVVGDLEQVFLEDWAFAKGQPLPPPPLPAKHATWSAAERREGSVVAVVPSGPDQEHNAAAMLYFTGITSARERVYLTSPYFVPDEPTVRALMSAALRGVDVRVLVPHRCDVALVGYAARSYYPALLRAGVRLFEYLPSMLHAKTMVIDSAWAVVGSANLDIRSFRLNFELSTVIADLAFAGRLEARFLRDLGAAREISPDDVRGRTRLARLRDGVARLLSPLL